MPTDDLDRALDADLGVPEVPDPGVPADVVPVVTDWEPPTDDELVASLGGYTNAVRLGWELSTDDETEA